MSIPMLNVCAAVVHRRQRFLLCQRPPGTHLAGHWEFPGGKVHANETLEECIARELHEELGVRIAGARLLTVVEHHYPEKSIRLHFLHCDLPEDQEPFGHEGQAVGWFQQQEFDALLLAPADRRFCAWIAAEWGASGGSG